MLFNLARCICLISLTGIPDNRCKYIRPMLSLSRKEIEAYAHDHGIAYVHDSSNDDVQHTRNYVRHEILPLMARMNSAAEANIVRAASLLKEDEDALRAAAAGAGCVRETDSETVIAIPKLALQHIAVQRRIVRGALAAKFSLRNIERVHVDSVLALAHKNESGTRADLPGNLEAAVVYGKLVIGKAPPKQYNKPLAALPENGRAECDKYVFDVCQYCGAPAYGAGVEYFDADVIEGAVFRRREQGDMITPLGMNGSKTLGDYLSDRKVPRRQRDELVVLAKGSEVFWAVSIGVSETSKVRSGGGVIKIMFWENDDA